MYLFRCLFSRPDTLPFFMLPSLQLVWTMLFLYNLHPGLVLFVHVLLKKWWIHPFVVEKQYDFVYNTLSTVSLVQVTQIRRHQNCSKSTNQTLVSNLKKLFDRLELSKLLVNVTASSNRRFSLQWRWRSLWNGFLPGTGAHRHKSILPPEINFALSGKKFRFLRVLAEQSQSVTAENNGHLALPLSGSPSNQALKTGVGFNQWIMNQHINKWMNKE